MEPLERLLNLVALLLETRTPLTFDQIRDTIRAYGADNVESAKRMFERDKDVLRAYGVPLQMHDLDGWGTDQGYVIPKDEYYLPEIAFSPEEVTALFVAAQGVREATEVEQGVRKLLYGAEGGVLSGIGGGPLVTGSDARGATVVAAADAAQRRRRVAFGYRTARGSGGARRVDAWGVVLRGGHWYLVGHDHDRDEVRAFRLSRVTTDLGDEGEGSAPPERFRALDHVEAGPWVGGQQVARVAFEPHVAWLALDAFPGAREEAILADGRIDVSLPYTDPALVASLLLHYGPDAEVTAPADLRETVVRRLQETLDV